MPKDHPFYVNKFLTKKKTDHKKSYGIKVNKQAATPVSLAFLIKCQKMYDSGQLEAVVKLLEGMNDIEDPNVEKQVNFMLVNCQYKLGEYKKVAAGIKQMCENPEAQKSNNDIMVGSSFVCEHQMYYLGGKSCDKIKDYQNAIVYYRKAVKVMEETEKVDIDYKPLKFAQVKMRLGFSLILSAHKDKDFEMVDEGIKILREVEKEIGKKY